MLFPNRLTLGRKTKEIAGRIRGLSAGNYPQNSDKQIAQTSCGALTQVQGLPRYAEIVRLGNSWQGMFPGGQFADFAGVGLKTTAPSASDGAILAYYNTSQTTHVIIESITVVLREWVTSTNTPIFSFAYRFPLATEAFPPPLESAEPLDISQHQVASLSGQRRYTHALKYRNYNSSGTTFPNFTPMGPSLDFSAVSGSATAALRTTVEIPLHGRVWIPPRKEIQFCVFSLTVGSAFFNVAMRWHELDSPAYR